MDIELPGMNGIEVTKIIKSIHNNLPVIALTSYAMIGDREKLMAAGFDEYISKPIHVPDFIMIVEKHKKYKK